jgi:hypothetical protein
MFPSAQELDAFRAEFGPESVIHRMQIPRRDSWGTQVAASILRQSSGMTGPTTMERLRLLRSR